jgi:hypothetical protein
MKTIEFESRLNPDGTLRVPEDVIAQVPPGEPVRVVLVVGDPNEDQEWTRLAAAQFLKGYAESDGIYDQLSGG